MNKTVNINNEHDLRNAVKGTPMEGTVEYLLELAKRAHLYQVLYVLYEQGCFLGAFTTKTKARNLISVRVAAGKPRPEMVMYYPHWEEPDD